ncbi:MAG: hypothetical protein VW397_08720, partial [Candidatus Margulisiibacteriota bacterium]
VLENYKGDGKTILENFNTEVCLEHDIKQLLINRSLKLKSKIPEFYTDPTTGMVNISENSSYSYDQLTYLLPSEAILIQNSEAEIIEVPVFKSEISDLKSKSVNDLTPPTMDKDVAVPTSTFMQRSGYNALATGILGLGDADRDHCLEKLKIKELVSPLLATSYTHDHLQMLQEMIGIFIYEFALSNEADIKIKVIQQDSKGIDSEKLAALQKMNIFEELDPLFLIKLGEMIGLKVVVPGSAKMHKDDLTYPVVNINQVGKNYEGRLTESKLKSQSLQSKLNLTDLNETKFCEELLAKDHLTFNALVMVYKNLVFNRVDASKMSMLIGETQTGKTTIFQMLMGLYEANNEFSDAIGDGMESKTVLPKVFKYGNKLFMDTPGLEDTRNCLILTSLVHYQIIELLKSGKLSQLILTFNPKDFDSESSANNSLKKFVTFFQSICNIRALDGGFYENEMETIINELRAKNYALLPLQNEKSMAALGKQHWETFFERLEKRIEKMPTLPFKAIVKGIKHATESSIISEIDKQIAQYKAKCIGRMVSGYDDKGLRQDVSRDFLINYLIFLMIIRRTITVNNCPDSEEQLRAEILDHENDFDYTSIFLEEDQITDEHGVLKRFSDQIDEVLNEKEQWINSYFNCIENIRNKMKEIDSLVV